jgi:insertion element IS1 protein InsB
VEDSQHIGATEREMIQRLLLERLSLAGICRVMNVSLRWLLTFIEQLYQALPPDLNVRWPQSPDGPVALLCLDAEADEMWSFVQCKNNKQWVWLALDVTTRQVLACHIGDRSRASAQKLWAQLPAAYRAQATFRTDAWDAYQEVIPRAQHEVCAKGSGKTNLIERFNCTLRQRVSRLVRETLSFSKSLANHIGAIKYFICHYNLVVTGRT